MLPTSVTLALPPWADEVSPPPLPQVADRMALVLRLAARNVAEGSGGPFAAGVFTRDEGRLVSFGVNCVVPQRSSLAHAEIMAIGLAHRALGTYDLGAPGLPRLQLVSSSQMCAMCLGAVIWSGVTDVAFSTTSEDVVAVVGFDEGPTPTRYCQELEQRGIHVLPQLLRDEGLAVLRAYVAGGGVVYNAHH
ncbi:MAG TPA: nucleoside deaminase [Candidatus Nanopelagicales bacterium]